MEMEEVLKKAEEAANENPGELSDEEKQKLLDEEEKKKNALPELNEEQKEALLIQMFGVGSKGLVKKEEKPHVPTEEEKVKLEQDKQSAILKFGLESGLVSAKDHEEYITATKANKVEIAKKVLEGLGDDVKASIDKIFRLDEPDEITEEGEENPKPNVVKAAGMRLLEKIANDDLDFRFDGIKKLPNAYEEFQQREALKVSNTKLIKDAIAGVSKRVEMEVAGVKYGIDLPDEEINAAEQLILKDAVLNKDLKPEEVVGTATNMLMVRNFKKLLEEGITVAVKRREDEIARGGKGVIRDEKEGGVQVSEGQQLVDTIKKQQT